MRFTKNDSRKSRLDLVPADALELVGHVLAHGARFYAPRNWEKCQDPSKYVAALLRHSYKHLKGEFTDPETALPHLASAACNALFALALYLRGVEDDTMIGNYFAIVERTGPAKGKVVKRFKSYTRAWVHFESEELDFDVYTIKTVSVHEKPGDSTSLPKRKHKKKS